MKISIKKLQKIIKEEIENVLKETGYDYDDIMGSDSEESKIEVSKKQVEAELKRHYMDYKEEVLDPLFPKPIGHDEEGEPIYDAKHIMSFLGY